MYNEKLLIVEDVESFGHFVTKLLDKCSTASSAKKVVGSSSSNRSGGARLRSFRQDKVIFGIASSRNSSLLVLVQRSSCSPQVLAAFGNMCVTRVYICVHKSIDMTALLHMLQGDAGSDSDSHCKVRVLQNTLGTRERDSIVVQGPEKIVFHLVRDTAIEIARNSEGDGEDSFEVISRERGGSAGTEESSDQYPDRRARSGTGVSSSSEMEDDREMEMIDNCKYIISDITKKFGKKQHKPKTVRQLAIPTLDCNILSNGRFRPLVPSALKPMPFETDFFIGIAFFTHKHETLDPRFAPFYPSHRKVTYEIQVQGKFKRLPEGEIFCGAEATEKMELGFMTRQFSRACMSFAGITVENLHYSFGDLKSNPDHEFPHLVGPLFPTLDKIIETPDGEVPPELGIPFVEDPDYRKKRVKWSSIKDAHVSLEKTYSFSVNTQNLDFVQWQFVNIPALGYKDLCDFFGDSPLRLVAYEVPREVVQQYKTHPQRCCNYVFNVCCSRIIPGEESDRARMLSDLEWEGMTDEENELSEVFDLDAEIGDADTNEGNSMSFVDSSDTAAKMLNDDSESDKDDEDDDTVLLVPGDHGNDEINAELDNVDEGRLGHSLDLEGDDGGDTSGMEEDRKAGGGAEEGSTPKFKYREGGGSAPSKLRRNQYISFTDGSGNGGVHDGYVKNLFKGITSNIPVVSVLDIPDTAGDYLAPNHESETSLSRRYCPAIVEVFDYKKKATNMMYLLPLASTDGKLVPRLRSYDDIAKKLHMKPIPKLHKNKLMVSIEKKRRQVVESYSAALASNVPKVTDSLRALLQTETETDQHFLTHSAKSFRILSLGRNTASNPEKLWDGSVALALGNRHWIEYYMIITKDGAGISHHQGAKEMWIPLSSMIRAKAMAPEDTSFVGFSCIFIETLRKMYYLMVKDEHVQKNLLHTLHSLGVIEDRSIDKSTSVGVDDIFPQLIFKSRMEIWKLQKRRLYNCRRLLFTTSGVPPACELAEKLLEKALQLSEIWTNRTRSLEVDDSKYELILLWIDFLDYLSNLQVVNVAALSDMERAAFFLNIHHVMVIHASLVLFPPQTSSNWQAFFQEVAYLISFDVVSIAEVEHNILKAVMTKPPRSAIGLGRAKQAPKSVFPGLALKHRDFRFNFCINNGSLAMPSTVCIYKAATLDEQLDHMTTLAVSVMMTVDISKRQVYLPMTCSWFAPDFVPTGAAVTPVDCLRTIAMYCRPDDRKALESMLLSGTIPTVKYRPYSFQSRLISGEKVSCIGGAKSNVSVASEGV